MSEYICKQGPAGGDLVPLICINFDPMFCTKLNTDVNSRRILAILVLYEFYGLGPGSGFDLESIGPLTATQRVKTFVNKATRLAPASAWRVVTSPANSDPLFVQKMDVSKFSDFGDVFEPLAVDIFRRDKKQQKIYSFLRFVSEGHRRGRLGSGCILPSNSILCLFKKCAPHFPC